MESGRPPKSAEIRPVVEGFGTHLFDEGESLGERERRAAFRGEIGTGDRARETADRFHPEMDPPAGRERARRRIRELSSDVSASGEQDLFLERMLAAESGERLDEPARFGAAERLRRRRIRDLGQREIELSRVARPR